MPTRETKPTLLSAGAGLVGAIAAESAAELGEGTEPVRARAYWEQVWLRFRRDRVAMASGIFIVFLILVAIFGGPIAAALLGHGPNDIFFSGVNNDLLPVGLWTHVLLAAAPDFYKTVPWLMLWPGLAVLLTTLAFNLFGDGLRDAFDPRATQR
jgi:ABC-type antimicrobial peptide transport system permease subunit